MHSPLLLSPSSTALLLVDLQEEQRADPTIAAANLDTVLIDCVRLLAVARARGVAVFHAAYCRDFGVCPPRPFEPMAPGGGPSFSGKDNPLIAICKEVAPLPNETVIHKNDASAFEEGSLTPRLRELGIEWLVVAGVWTEQCIAASIRDAMAAGFRVLIVKDACTSGTEAMHKTAILNLANRLYGGAIADVTRTVALLQGLEAQVWRTVTPVPIRFNGADFSTHYDSL
jgi:maleamate amidohydrolase